MTGPEIAAGAGQDAAVPEIPEKLYFRIGEVAKLAGIKPYVLRFWEAEFPSLGPKKSPTGHRLYRRKDVEQVLEIKRLLYDRRYTIEGARKFLEDRTKTDKPKQPPPGKKGKAAKAQPDLFEALTRETLRAELEEILKLLK
jgi:DNA-binding transcriptional MerR regulator